MSATAHKKHGLKAMSAVALAVTAPAFAQRIEPTFDLAAVRVEVTWVKDAAELASIREKYEPRAGSMREAASIGTSERARGFSILGKRAGQDVCLLFLTKPTKLDDDRTTALGHELLHCLLGAYHK